jgi:hypothetical protein
MRWKFVVLAATAVSLCWTINPKIAAATLLTFDDLSVSPTDFTATISNGYGGFNWNNFFVYDETSNHIQPQPNGYQSGVVSSPNVAYNGFGSPASFSSLSAFTLNSFYLSAAWETGLTVSVIGRMNGAVVNSATVVVDPFGPTLEALNWTDINEVDFSTSAGSSEPPAYGNGTQFVLDEVSFTPAVPEPSTWAMLLIGFAGIAFAAHRKSRINPHPMLTFGSA